MTVTGERLSLGRPCHVNHCLRREIIVQKIRQFDKILSIHTLYFWPDPARAVAELRRVLKPGGLLALTFSPGKVGAPEDAEVRAIVHAHVIPAMEQSGFTVRVERGPDSRQYKALAVIGAMQPALNRSRVVEMAVPEFRQRQIEAELEAQYAEPESAEIQRELDDWRHIRRAAARRIRGVDGRRNGIV